MLQFNWLTLMIFVKFKNYKKASKLTPSKTLANVKNIFNCHSRVKRGDNKTACEKNGYKYAHRFKHFTG